VSTKPATTETKDSKAPVAIKIGAHHASAFITAAK
jgi:hypothetical protein